MPDRAMGVGWEWGGGGGGGTMYGRIEEYPDKYSSYFSMKTYIMGTQ